MRWPFLSLVFILFDSTFGVVKDISDDLFDSSIPCTLEAFADIDADKQLEIFVLDEKGKHV